MNHDALVTALRDFETRAGLNQSDKSLVPGLRLGEAAAAIEQLSGRVAELEAALLAATSGWADDDTSDTGVPVVQALDPTPLASIEARLAALEAAERPAPPLGT